MTVRAHVGSEVYRSVGSLEGSSLTRRGECLFCIVLSPELASQFFLVTSPWYVMCELRLGISKLNEAIEICQAARGSAFCKLEL